MPYAVGACVAGVGLVHPVTCTAPHSGRIVAEVGRPDVITFTNVFAHIDSLAEAIAARSALATAAAKLMINAADGEDAPVPRAARLRPEPRVRR